MAFSLNPRHQELPSAKPLIISTPQFPRLGATSDILAKRSLPADSQAMQMDLQKKIHTVPQINTLESAKSPQNPQNGNIPSGQPFGMGQNISMDLMMAQYNQRLQAMRQMQMMMDMQNQYMNIQNMQNMQNLNILQNGPISTQQNGKNEVKNKFLQDSGALTKPNTPSSEEKSPEKGANTPNNNKEQRKLSQNIDGSINEFPVFDGPIECEPVLHEITRNFPHWDLATIFDFLRSEKSEEAFEKERQIKLSQKRGRQAKKAMLGQKKAK